MGPYSWIVNYSHLTKSNVDLAYCRYSWHHLNANARSVEQSSYHMTLVIKYVNIIFHDCVCVFIMWIKVWVFHPHNVDKNGDLVVMLMHGLHFILDFKAIVLCKIYHRNYSIIYKILKGRLEHWILQSCQKITVGKELKFGL
jgi:hypothetical protein